MDDVEVFYEGDLITRKEAFNSNGVYYFTGKPCKYNHIDRREVCSGQCVRCKRLRTSRYRNEGSVDKPIKPTPSVERLIYLFNFDLDKGIIYYKERPKTYFKDLRAYKAYNTRFLGKQAGSLQKSVGYREIRIDGELFREHRVLWKVAYGKDADSLIDHINGIKEDNRLTNLREGTNQENSANKTPSRNHTSYKGVTYRKGKWDVTISKDNGETIARKSFNSEIEAAKYYNKKAREFFGDFAKLNIIEENDDK